MDLKMFVGRPGFLGNSKGHSRDVLQSLCTELTKFLFNRFKDHSRPQLRYAYLDQHQRTSAWPTSLTIQVRLLSSYVGLRCY